MPPKKKKRPSNKIITRKRGKIRGTRQKETFKIKKSRKKQRTKRKKRKKKIRRKNNQLQRTYGKFRGIQKGGVTSAFARVARVVERLDIESMIKMLGALNDIKCEIAISKDFKREVEVLLRDSDTKVPLERCLYLMYEVGPIGRGAFGAVYKGKLNRVEDVAVKIMKIEDKTGQDVYNNEKEILTNLLRNIKYPVLRSKDDIKAERDLILANRDKFSEEPSELLAAAEHPNPEAFETGLKFKYPYEICSISPLIEKEGMVVEVAEAKSEIYRDAQLPVPARNAFIMELYDGYEMLHLLTSGIFEQCQRKVGGGWAFQRQYAVNIICDVLIQLYAMHRIGIVHGDIKADNIMITKGNVIDGPDERFDVGRAILIDFGFTFDQRKTGVFQANTRKEIRRNKELDSELVGHYDVGDIFIALEHDKENNFFHISEQGEVRNRTEMGWITLEPEEAVRPLKPSRGTYQYAAPEQLGYNHETKVWEKDKPYDATKSDMFSIGVVLYLLLKARYPFRYAPKRPTTIAGMEEPLAGDQGMIDKIRRLRGELCDSVSQMQWTWPDDLSDEVLTTPFKDGQPPLITIIGRLLDDDPAKRYDAKQLYMLLNKNTEGHDRTFPDDLYFTTGTESEVDPVVELKGMGLGALSARARSLGMTHEEIDAAQDEPKPKDAVIQLILNPFVRKAEEKERSLFTTRSLKEQIARQKRVKEVRVALHQAELDRATEPSPEVEEGAF